MTAPLDLDDVVEIVDGPYRVGSERRFRVRRRDGSLAIFATLLPELASDEAVRRRYLRDLERRAALDDPGLAPLLARGTGDDGGAPWRLRVFVPGDVLADVLERRAPLPVAEVARIGAQLADILHRLHRLGVVLRDLNPKLVVLTDDGPILTDVGLARVDLLSTRTAASLVLEGSPYASPEQLRKTTVDQRSDLYGLAVILWEGLTGTLPFGEGLALLRDDAEPPSLRAIRPEVDARLAEVVERSLAADPETRPDSADEVARVLRGGDLVDERARTTCQHCMAELRAGQRLCTRCGRVAVRYEHTADDDPQRRRIVLRRVKEHAEQLAALRQTLESVSEGPVPPLNFIVGDQRMYSKEEQQRALRLPLVLFEDVSPATAKVLTTQLARAGVKVVDRPARRAANRIARASLGAAIGATVLGLIVAGAPVFAVVTLAAIIGILVVVVVARRRADHKTALLQLRRGPAALPASDPLVSRLAALVGDDTPDDVRERIGELALAVQELVDHRARLRDAADQAELDAVTEPIAPLIGLVEKEVRRMADIDRRLASLDEGALVRGLAAASARGAPPSQRQELLDALDRLRGLEDERAGAMHRLLEAASLLRRAVGLGLEVRDADAHYERQVQLALASLQAGEA